MLTLIPFVVVPLMLLRQAVRARPVSEAFCVQSYYLGNLVLWFAFM